MHLLAISLLSILAGTLLLAKFKKDVPGKFFSFIAWFFVVVGFILFIGFIAGGICKLKHHCVGRHQNCQHGMMMKDCNPGMMMKDCNHGMRGGFCCPKGMDGEMHPGKPGCMPNDSTMKCCPKGMDKGMCSGKAACTGHDSTMKSCPKRMEGDPAKEPVQKK
jgi:hypothetical protein